MKWLDNFIVSERGQWEHPGKPTAVPTKDGRITMQGVPYPLFAMDETGYGGMIYPEGNYQFRGNMVYEIPMAYGGDISIPDLSRPNWLDKAQKGQQVKYYDDLEEFKKANQAYNDSLTVYNAPKTSYDRATEISDAIDNGDFQKANDLLAKPYPSYNAFRRLTILNHKPPQPVSGYPIYLGFNPSDPLVPKFKKPTQKPVYKEKPKEYTPTKTPRLEREPLQLVIPQSDRTLMPYNNTRQVLRGIQEEDKSNENLYPTRVVLAPTFRHGGWLDKAQKGLQYTGEPTRADSLELLKNSRMVLDYYNSKNYTADSPKYLKNAPGKNQFMDETMNAHKVYDPTVKQLTSTGLRPVPLKEYFQPVDNNKFYQRELAYGILDTNSPMVLYDKRIQPTTVRQYNNNDLSSPIVGDVAVLSMYDPLSITPWDMLTDAQKKLRVQRFGRDGVPEDYDPDRPSVPKNLPYKNVQLLQQPEDRLVREYNTIVPNEDYRRVYDKSPYSVKEYGPEGQPTHWAKADEKIPGIWRPVKGTPSDVFVSKKVKFSNGGRLDEYQGDKESSQVAANLPGYNPEVGPTVKNAELLKQLEMQEAVRNSQSLNLPSGRIDATLGPVEYAVLPALATPVIKAAMAPKAPADPELEAIRKILRKNVTHIKQTGPLTETPPWPNRFLHLSDDARVIGNMERGRASIPNPDVDLPGRLPKPTPKQLPGVNGTQYPNRLPKQKYGGWLDNY